MRIQFVALCLVISLLAGCPPEQQGRDSVSSSGSAKSSSSVSEDRPCTNGATLNVSGVATGTMTGTGPWYCHIFMPSSTVGVCSYQIQLECVAGELSGYGSLTGSPISCPVPAPGVVEIVSHDPILIEITFPPLVGSCGCNGGLVTISE